MLTERELLLVNLLKKQATHLATRNLMAMQAVKENTTEAYQAFFNDVHVGEMALLRETNETLAGILKELGDGRHTEKG